MLGGKPLHTFEDYTQTAGLKAVADVSDGNEGVQAVLDNSRYLLKRFYEILEIAGDDEGTVTMMSDLIGATEKRIWMFDSVLG